jgi:hypothetical protein
MNCYSIHRVVSIELHDHHAVRHVCTILCDIILSVASLIRVELYSELILCHVLFEFTAQGRRHVGHKHESSLIYFTTSSPSDTVPYTSRSNYKSRSSARPCRIGRS